MLGNLLTPTHLIIVLLVALFVLGPRRLPEAGRSLGSGLRGFKDALTESEPAPAAGECDDGGSHSG
jgi:sec-independent protein translocase protein TatA